MRGTSDLELLTRKYFSLSLRIGHFRDSREPRLRGCPVGVPVTNDQPNVVAPVRVDENAVITPDDRFVVRKGLVHDNDWALQIKQLDKNTDSCLYQCQASNLLDGNVVNQYYQLNIVGKLSIYLPGSSYTN